ncbi:hypothetical protein NPIL_643361 [Nephila pilipes]|uniref:Uncharacterized protein n=1 Tax=Nephila pilipes TaxID=299642 RepID=A0A8X6M6Y0_NEPPI|nr:hypothetical protein NPIL_643361 [Nephila pilipes]
MNNQSNATELLAVATRAAKREKVSQIFSEKEDRQLKEVAGCFLFLDKYGFLLPCQVSHHEKRYLILSYVQVGTTPRFCERWKQLLAFVNVEVSSFRLKVNGCFLKVMAKVISQPDPLRLKNSN